MKRLLYLLSMCLFAHTAMAQITITSADMPIAGDTIRHSNASIFLTNVNLNDTGANKTWDYSNMIPLSQALDSFRTPTDISFTYFLLPAGCVGLRTNVDILTGLPLPVPISDVYSFYQVQNTPVNAYVTKALGASVSGISLPFTYTDVDERFFFPITYGRRDSSTYLENISLPTVGSIKISGYRITKADAWGTIKTPYYSTPTPCLRVRSEIHEIDSITLSTGAPIAYPRNSVEFRWMVNGDHYPALFCTANLINPTTVAIASIDFRDVYRPDLNPSAVNNTNSPFTLIQAYPNPSSNGVYTLTLPESWNNFTTEVFDMQGKAVSSGTTREVNISTLPKGDYLIIVTHGIDRGLVKVTK
jgi:Secretion system C-terminal sorting domain